MRIEIYPRAEADITRQFRYYLVEQESPAVAFRFREAVQASIQRELAKAVGRSVSMVIPGSLDYPNVP